VKAATSKRSASGGAATSAVQLMGKGALPDCAGVLFFNERPGTWDFK
jgi:hypothetical protein